MKGFTKIAVIHEANKLKKRNELDSFRVQIGAGPNSSRSRLSNHQQEMFSSSSSPSVRMPNTSTHSRNSKSVLAAKIAAGASVLSPKATSGKSLIILKKKVNATRTHSSNNPTNNNSNGIKENTQPQVMKRKTTSATAASTRVTQPKSVPVNSEQNSSNLHQRQLQQQVRQRAVAPTSTTISSLLDHGASVLTPKSNMKRVTTILSPQNKANHNNSLIGSAQVILRSPKIQNIYQSSQRNNDRHNKQAAHKHKKTASETYSQQMEHFCTQMSSQKATSDKPVGTAELNKMLQTAGADISSVTPSNKSELQIQERPPILVQETSDKSAKANGRRLLISPNNAASLTQPTQQRKKFISPVASPTDSKNSGGCGTPSNNIVGKVNNNYMDSSRDQNRKRVNSTNFSNKQVIASAISSSRTALTSVLSAKHRKRSIQINDFYQSKESSSKQQSSTKTLAAMKTGGKQLIQPQSAISPTNQRQQQQHIKNTKHTKGIIKPPTSKKQSQQLQQSTQDVKQQQKTNLVTTSTNPTKVKRTTKAKTVSFIKIGNRKESQASKQQQSSLKQKKLENSDFSGLDFVSDINHSRSQIASNQKIQKLALSPKNNNNIAYDNDTNTHEIKEVVIGLAELQMESMNLFKNGSNRGVQMDFQQDEYRNQVIDDRVDIENQNLSISIGDSQKDRIEQALLAQRELAERELELQEMEAKLEQDFYWVTSENNCDQSNQNTKNAIQSIPSNPSPVKSGELRQYCHSSSISTDQKNLTQILATGGIEYENSNDRQAEHLTHATAPLFNTSESDLIYKKPKKSARDAGAERYSGTPCALLDKSKDDDDLKKRNYEEFLEPSPSQVESKIEMVRVAQTITKNSQIQEQNKQQNSSDIIQKADTKQSNPTQQSSNYFKFFDYDEQDNEEMISGQVTSKELGEPSARETDNEKPSARFANLAQSYEIMKEYSQNDKLEQKSIHHVTEQSQQKQQQSQSASNHKGIVKHLTGTSSRKKRHAQDGAWMSSQMCSSLRSSRLNLASVASELEFNQENVTQMSVDISNNDIGIQLQEIQYATPQQQPQRLAQVGHPQMRKSGALAKNFKNLPSKQVKMMDNMGMDDFGFQQRILQRMMELTSKKEEMTKEKQKEAARQGGRVDEPKFESRVILSQDFNLGSSVRYSQRSDYYQKQPPSQEKVLQYHQVPVKDSMATFGLTMSEFDSEANFGSPTDILNNGQSNSTSQQRQSMKNSGMNNFDKTKVTAVRLSTESNNSCQQEKQNNNLIHQYPTNQPQHQQRAFGMSQQNKITVYDDGMGEFKSSFAKTPTKDSCQDLFNISEKPVEESKFDKKQLKVNNSQISPPAFSTFPLRNQNKKNDMVVAPQVSQFVQQKGSLLDGDDDQINKQTEAPVFIVQQQITNSDHLVQMLASSCESSQSPELTVKSVKASKISNNRRDSDSDRYNNVMIVSQQIAKNSAESLPSVVSETQKIIMHKASAFQVDDDDEMIPNQIKIPRQITLSGNRNNSRGSSQGNSQNYKQNSNSNNSNRSISLSTCLQGQKKTLHQETQQKKPLIATNSGQSSYNGSQSRQVKSGQSDSSIQLASFMSNCGGGVGDPFQSVNVTDPNLSSQRRQLGSKFVRPVVRNSLVDSDDDLK